MKAKNRQTGKFKSKGANILKANKADPNSMNEFLEGNLPKIPQLQKVPVAQLHKTTQ